MAISDKQREYFKNKFAGQGADVNVDPKERIKSIVSSVSRPEPMGFFEETIGDVKETFQGIGRVAGERADKYGDIVEAQQQGKQGTIRSLFQKFGQGAGFASDIAGEVVKGGVKTLLPQGLESDVKETVTGVAETIAETSPVQTLIKNYQNLKETDPEKAKDIDALLGIGSLALDVATAGFGTKPAISAVKKTADVATDLTKAGLGKVKQVATGIDTATGGFVTQTPKRIATNFQARKELAKQVDTLGESLAKQSVSPKVKTIVRSAVSNNVDPRDIGVIGRLAKSPVKDSIKELYQSAKSVAKGADLDLPQLVGRPAINALQKTKSELSKLGKQLDIVSTKLPKVTKAETVPALFNELKKVRGLSGLKLTKNGRLDFSDTALTLTESASDRRAIESIFIQASRASNGSTKHKLRQELFEILGGKKKSLTNITDTQEQAFEAMRKGLANVLDKKSPRYKELNKKYATLRQPVNELNKRLKAGIDDDIDILESTAGDLARRLTSNAPSRNEIFKLFKKLGVGDEVKDLQDALNVFSKYLDIAQKTSLQGITETALSKSLPTNPLEVAGEILKATGGTTKEVTEKSLDDLINALF